MANRRNKNRGAGRPDPTKDRSAHEAARGKKMPTLSDLSREMPTGDELASFSALIANEPSDRSAAIMSASLVEHALFAALIARLADCGETVRNTWFHDANAPFGTFSAKIKLGRALGIYGPKMEKRLNRVKDIRNVFAHRASPIDFSHPTIAKEVRGFTTTVVVPKDKIQEHYSGACLALAELLAKDGVKHGGMSLTLSFP